MLPVIPFTRHHFYSGGDTSKPVVATSPTTTTTTTLGYRRFRNSSSSSSIAIDKKPSQDVLTDRIRRSERRLSYERVLREDNNDNKPVIDKVDLSMRGDSMNSASSSMYIIPTSVNTLTKGEGSNVVLSPSKKLGLWNVGNTCYTNSVLQVLYENHFFRECCESEIGYAESVRYHQFNCAHSDNVELYMHYD